MVRKIELTLALLTLIVGAGLSGIAQEEKKIEVSNKNRKASAAYTELFPIKDFGQQKILLQNNVSSREIALGTAIINSFHGPFRNVSLFSTRSELVNANNTFISSVFDKRSGLRVPLGSSLNFVIQTERLPNYGIVTPMAHFRNGGASIGVEMRVGGNPFSRRRWK